ncbi:MAG: hypothetical protein M3O50_20215 [Myxococcota bacterium]|nr:hypothetical protein [Myxococcota bacterium]
MTMEDAMALLQGLTTQQMRTLVLTRLTHDEAARYDVLTRAVSYDVLLLVSARTILRQGRHHRSSARTDLAM